MTFLPIVERELRVAARKRGTFWLRVVAALVALVIGAGFVVIGLLASFMPTGGRMQMGAPLFATLTWLSLATVLGAGIFFTADCLSEEKREGTLGFLFLTDLRGYDVVLGKLLATSLRGFFALLAIFPVLATTLMLGGVDPNMFWKTLLALINALFFSLAGGMFVSAVSRDSQKAMAATLTLIVFFLAGGPALDSALSVIKGFHFQRFFSLTSPGFAFAMANGWVPLYWRSLLVSHLTGWIFLGLACGLIPRTWQLKAEKTATPLSRWSFWWRYGGAKRRASLRRKFLDLNPITWLACRERWQGILVWAVSITLLLVFVQAWRLRMPQNFWAGWGFVGGGVLMIFYFWTASQASRFFVDARRNGLIELLVAAPLSSREIVQGPWRALCRLFGLPLIILLGVQFFAQLLTHRATWGAMTAAMGNGPAVAVTGLAIAAGGTLVIAANLVALGWFGLWMGMTSKNAPLAVLKTLAFVQIIPWFVISFVSSLALGLLMLWVMMPALAKGNTPNPGRVMAWYPIISAGLACALSLAKDVLFVVWARRKLFGDFRAMATRIVAPVRPTAHYSAPRPVNAPPVIPTKTQA